jgi:lipoprotein-anchoring transpeptidase ErfK/SrfK
MSFLFLMRNIPVALACMAMLMLGACASYDGRLNSSATQYLGTDGSIVTRTSTASLADRISYWAGESASGPAHIVISIPEQKLFYYKGGKLVGISAVSTGREGHDSPVGNFKVQKKEKEHASNLYGDFVDASGTAVVKNVTYKVDVPPPGTHFQGSSMQWFMQFAPGVGMHKGFLPGVPDSHGCIRLPERMAKIFYDVTPLGTPVTVEK